MPALYDALLLDLDGVLTRTAVVHAAAWKRLFDDYLVRRGARDGRAYDPFDAEDYGRHFHGKPRPDGVRSFLAARGITLPDGGPDDGGGAETVHGLGNRKNRYFLEALSRDGVEVFPDAVALLETAREAGLRLAVVSSSRNCAAVLDAAGLADRVDVRIDGVDLARLDLPGKPDPALFLEASRRLRVPPDRAVVVEDAVSGVEAGVRGNFALIVGVDRDRRGNALQRAGAHIVVEDLRTVRIVGPRIRSALAAFDAIAQRLRTRRAAVFLDYDGTLTPIVDRPEHAVLSSAMRRTIQTLAGRCPVAIVSGRDRVDVARLVGLDDLYYAGSHGFDISGPDGFSMQHQEGAERIPELQRARSELQDRLRDIPGVLVESKRYAIAIHFRLAPPARIGEIGAVVDEVASRLPGLRRTAGKMIHELRPRLDWDKGTAVLWLLDALQLAQDVLPLYLGDDETDEDAFRALRDGIGIIVADEPRRSHASFGLRDPDEVRTFLVRLADAIARPAR